MKGKSAVMKNELRTIAGYKALILSKYYLTILLGLISFYLYYLHFAASSLYILIMLNCLPPIFSYVLKEHSKVHKNSLLTELALDSPFQLKYTKRKYKYSKTSYVTNQTAYLISMFLMGIWQVNYSQTVNLNIFLKVIPLFTMITGLTLRCFAVFLYQIKLSYDLMNNKV